MRQTSTAWQPVAVIPPLTVDQSAGEPFAPSRTP
jgi:hypothetical protein